MRVALTGSRGWIGRSLLSKLEFDGVDVIPLQGSVLDPSTFDVDFDFLIHLAALLPHHFERDFSGGFQVNVRGTQLALDACVKKGAALVLASTSGVYDRHVQGALEEEGVFIQPPHPYGQSKWLAEQLCYFYHARFQVPVAVLRLFNVYGPYQSDTLLVGYLVQQALLKQTITLHTPHSKRDFVHLYDVVDAFSATIQTFSGLKVCNIGQGEAHSVLDVVKTLERIVGYSLDIRQPTPERGLGDSVFAKIDQAQTWLAWKPKVGLLDGLQSCLFPKNR